MTQRPKARHLLGLQHFVGVMLAAILSLGCARSSPVSEPPGGPEAIQDRARAEAEAGPEPEALKVPPPSGLATVPRVPPTTTEALDNGFRVQVLERHGVPLVQLSLLIKSGRSSELDRTGVASLATDLAKFGGAGSYGGMSLVDAFAAIGSELTVDVSSDGTLLSTVTTHDHWQTALTLLGVLSQKPRLPLTTFTELKQRAIANAEALALSDDAWATRLVLYRELFTLPTGIHPYARFDATTAHLEQLSYADCKAWLSAHMTPDNTELIVVGDVSTNELVERARSTFAGWQGTRAPNPVATRPTGPERLSVFVVDREDQPLVNLLLGLVGAPRTSAAWPALSAATHLLGGSRASRLYLELVENRHLALWARARLRPFAGRMPALIEVTATSESGRVEPTVRAMLEQVSRMGSTPPDRDDLELSARSLVDGFLMRLGTRTALTGLLAERSTLELGEDYFDEYREELLELTPKAVHATVAPYFDTTRGVLVVAGSAKTVAKPLSRFGPVSVLDPSKDFSIKKRFSHDPTGSP